MSYEQNRVKIGGLKDNIMHVLSAKLTSRLEFVHRRIRKPWIRASCHACRYMCKLILGLAVVRSLELDGPIG